MEVLFLSRVIRKQRVIRRELMSTARPRRIIFLCDVIALILVLTVTYKPESRSSHYRLPMVTLFQCKTLPSHEFLLFETPGSYERPRGRFRTSLNERQLFLVCTDRVSRQLKLRVDRSQDGRVLTRTLALD